MRRYLLDTTPLSAYLSGRPAAVARFDPWLAEAELATSLLVYGEVVEGLLGRPHFPALQQALRELLVAGIYPYTLTYSIVQRYALLRRQMRPPRGPGLIGDVDTLIAATALERRLTVVTSDADFERVPELSVLLIPRSAFSAR